MARQYALPLSKRRPADVPASAGTPQPDVQAGAGPAAIAAARAADTAPEIKGGSDHYRKMREPFAAELKDPATRRLVLGIISAENPGAGPAVVESLMNRTAMVNEARRANGAAPLTLKAMIQGDPSIGGGKSFYGPVRTGAISEHLARVDADKGYAAQLDNHVRAALGGSDTIKGHTDQGSKGDPNYDTGGVGVNINGERFNDWGYGGARAWREKQQAMAGSGGGATEYLDPTPGVGAGQGYYDNAATTAVASGGGGEGGTGSAAAAPAPAPAEKEKDYRGAIGDAFTDMGKMFAAGPMMQNAARASAPANVAAPQAPMPQGPVSMVDPKMADAQRQQLAMALQRLNSGKLV